ncbi:TetR/AcrR family transcriptional regulator [Glutamicibacter protophormiae]|uniref:TetR/AcrR family transcriptional regulator n=1 Tax=Glutamicibacter protophormiae TaxID=37930 RepID=UPI002A830ED0|nr:TetR/AcrR family transcriptional regulator [Glutamicibacter protophormiae]WPR65105.1 TetR/AcrR family transcriptional regulator [Glutamicibacter protophormiae]WPR68602.1 TetR/AcrR family transcriptional regulator [Glutamicibacter protophormiae]
MTIQPRTLKGQETQAKLLQTALDCFAAEGYKASSMRVIAARAGVSLSHAYYYFSSKEDIVARLLLNLRTEQFERCRSALDEGNTLESNIRAVFTSGLSVLQPYHEFGPAFLKVLLSQDQVDNELSAVEFSLWEKAVSGARPLPPLGIRSDLPKFLSLLSRQLFSVWAYDQSANQRRSLLLMDNAAPVAAKFAVLCRLPVVRSLFADVLALMDSGSSVQDHQDRQTTGSKVPKAS